VGNIQTPLVGKITPPATMVKRFDRAGLTWPLATELGNAELEAKLYGAAGSRLAVVDFPRRTGRACTAN